MFGTSAASLQKSGQLGHGNNPALGQEFLDLIDDDSTSAVARNPGCERLSKLDSGVQVADNPEHPAMDRAGYEAEVITIATG